jgi:hypothetical protein
VQYGHRCLFPPAVVPGPEILDEVGWTDAAGILFQVWSRQRRCRVVAINRRAPGLNAIFTTWATVIDAERPTPLARREGGDVTAF